MSRRAPSAVATVAGRRLIRLAVLTATALACYVTAVVAAPAVLGVETVLVPADLIVVLGGDGAPRSAAAAALFRSGYAPTVLITGNGDCEDNRALLAAAGIPVTAIIVECGSRNTMENARLSAPIVRRLAATRVILVTSWWHTRRALDCFRAASPGITIMVAPVGPPEPPWRASIGAEGRNLTAEYVKTLWYAVRYAGRS